MQGAPHAHKNILTARTTPEHYLGRTATAMPADRESQPRSEPDRLEAATDEAIAVCGGNARDAVKALILANEFLEAQVEELRADVSNLLLSAKTARPPRRNAFPQLASANPFELLSSYHLYKK